ncbi:hypothetical protein ACFFTM_14005 [Pseudoduganella plicata]|uniref:Uncharacterized protein n=1 Tax=Pseudoduganella plicata TaxID=321984 RepID=A0A4V1ATF8_9BURK|nr:hypothetical protein [Pseudoduganella plicata]QBQ35518.1 hypothetical protein E1742_04580 [Pseudoduganella plicata]GGY97233.1 hypothetical protein GCM10007388_33640 [Pseudoduganella plicata]
MPRPSKLDTVVSIVDQALTDAGYPRPKRGEDTPMRKVLSDELDKLAIILMAISKRLRDNKPSYTFPVDYAFCEKALEYDEIDLSAAVAARTS